MEIPRQTVVIYTRIEVGGPAPAGREFLRRFLRKSQQPRRWVVSLFDEMEGHWIPQKMEARTEQVRAYIEERVAACMGDWSLDK